jgi:hypothetical protein
MAASKVCLISGIFSKSVSNENGVLSRPQGRALQVKISAIATCLGDFYARTHKLYSLLSSLG